MSTELSTNLQKLLKYIGLTQKDFANEVGISEQYVSGIINEKYEKISNKLLKRISDQYRVSLDWLISGKGEMFGDLLSMNKLNEKFMENETLVNLMIKKMEGIESEFEGLKKEISDLRKENEELKKAKSNEKLSDNDVEKIVDSVRSALKS